MRCHAPVVRLAEGCGHGRTRGSLLTSGLAALLHAVLVDVQGEEHVGVAQLLLVALGPAAPAGSDGGIQEEGCLFCRGCAELALILELPTKHRHAPEATSVTHVRTSAAFPQHNKESYETKF